MKTSQLIYEFVSYAIKYGGWMEMDRVYLTNRTMALVGVKELEENSGETTVNADIDTLVSQLVEVALEQQTINDIAYEREMLEGRLGDLLTPPPSVLNALFAQQYNDDPKMATDYFYELSQVNQYIKTKAIQKNIVFDYPSRYGTLEITINLSKPEKNAKSIVAEQRQAKRAYPTCMLCMENEGYEGDVDYPARTNHRILRLNLDGESWGMQYSPYAYYNEHCIFLSEEHRPMTISEKTVARLLKIVEVFPHYFVGSNADLPIVGGSILAHDHYQGGRHTFPMAKAENAWTFPLILFPKVSAAVVNWPMSVIRLQSASQTDLVKAATYIMKQWENHDDLDLGIRAFSEDGTRHHTVTPIARMRDNQYELDLVLRDNNTSEEHPEGIFHPHRDVQHIKQENIGLIEVMGLAILPPRLKQELSEVEAYLLGETTDVAEIHRDWAREMKGTYNVTKENVTEIIQKEVGKKFERVLEDAGVYKQTAEGQAGFKRFIDKL
ncbi:UDP-glucose--hexose-1-phosphate uridylyltransferase [Vagococcus lutrae]|uniref:UDP-glucose--hexose-1-phosphate uridylyltransferase n=1 Tax=Vagococcus lutrae TaxID=81947 RepID=UPI0023A9FA34|nr:UDP-glucose--hexose-1-phosphate uridylyltransferase [Vagococcus lutrae]WEB80739.1 UDP-glucose--hexose-1-phosphate uridylyltransferase [Vagococcus lutrae]